MLLRETVAACATELLTASHVRSGTAATAFAAVQILSEGVEERLRRHSGKLQAQPQSNKQHPGHTGTRTSWQHFHTQAGHNANGNYGITSILSPGSDDHQAAGSQPQLKIMHARAEEMRGLHDAMLLFSRWRGDMRTSRMLRTTLLHPHYRHFATSSTATSRSATTSADAKPPKPLLISELPDAKDCDEVLGDYDNLRNKAARISYPPTYIPWHQRAINLASGTFRILAITLQFLARTPGAIYRGITMPAAERSARLSSIWGVIKHEAHHYWVGMKLLAYEVRIAVGLGVKALGNERLTRRERRQLTRTAADVFRLVPMVVIVAIPFLELALPVLLRLFPNMLPSTFEDKLKKEEELKKRLVVKLELARFLQDTVAEMAKDLSKSSDGESSATAAELVQFMNKVRAGEVVDNEELLRFAPLFKDELTLDNLSRMQLVSICQFVGLTPFGTDAFLRSRLRAHLAKIKQDDSAIKEEGVENLTEDELRQACRDRGLRAPYGEGAPAFMRRHLEDWLKLSLQRGLPSSLLLLSRAFTITSKIRVAVPPGDAAAQRMEGLRETLAVLPDDVVEEVQLQALEALPPGASSGAQAMQMRLELLKREQELIQEEAEERSRLAAQTAAATAAPPLPPQTAAGLGLALAEAVHSAGAPEAVAAAAGLPSDSLDGLSDEEKAARVAEAREARMKQIIGALTVLASSSGVQRERALFMELVKKEIDRVNQVLTQRGTSQLTFSAGSLQANHPEDVEPEVVGASQALSDRVVKIIRRLEVELDSVEAQIGDKMHILDADNDGVISRQELEDAVRFLREQLGKEEVELLLERLNVASPEGKCSVHELLSADSSAADGDGDLSSPGSPPAKSS